MFVLLSSLLLVLHQDEYLFNNFNPDKQRYVPPLVNIETLLGMIAIVELYSSLSLVCFGMHPKSEYTHRCTYLARRAKLRVRRPPCLLGMALCTWNNQRRDCRS